MLEEIILHFLVFGVSVNRRWVITDVIVVINYRAMSHQVSYVQNYSFTIKYLIHET